VNRTTEQKDELKKRVYEFFISADYVIKIISASEIKQML